MNLQSLAGRIRRSLLTRPTVRAARKSARLRVESLEGREVPAVLPTPEIPETEKHSLGAGQAPMTIVDPLDPDRMVTVYTTGGGISAKYTTDGGDSWATLGVSGATSTISHTDFTTGSAFAAFTRFNEPTVAFDRFHNFFVTYTETNATQTVSGQLVIVKFDFSDPTKAPQFRSATSMEKWAGSGVTDNAVYTPFVAIDTNVGSFQDPDVAGAAGKQTDPHAALQTSAALTRVFVAWAVDSQKIVNNALVNFQAIKMIVSPDGGRTWSNPEYVNGGAANDGTNGGFNGNDSRPQIVFTQGRAGDADSGGKMLVFFNNNGGFATSFSDPATDADDEVAFESLPGSTGPIIDRPQDQNNVPLPPGDSVFTTTIRDIDVPTNFATIKDLDVTLNLSHSDLKELRVDLVSPTGIRVTLFDAAYRYPDGADLGTGINGRGVAGTQVGNLPAPGPVFHRPGTVFDDDAARDLRSAPSGFVGRFQPSGVTNGSFGPPGGGPASQSRLSAFNGLTRAQLLGDWKLEVLDDKNGGNTDTNNPSQVISWKLKFTSGGNPGFGGDRAAGVGTSASTADPTASPEAGYSVAVDNTLGKFSPYQNRVYLAYGNGGDVRLTYADVYDDGFGGDTHFLTSSVKVNDDFAGDGFSEGARRQFNPTIAVDPATGTLAMLYYDNRYDPADARSLTAFTTVVTAPEFGATTTPQDTPSVPFEFAKVAYLNHKEQAFDQVTTRLVDLEYVPTNLAGARGAAGATTQTFAEHAGLAVYAGRVSAVWAGNLNTNGIELRTQDEFRIAAGPRVVRGDMGPIAADAQDAGSGVKYNFQFDGGAGGDGRRIFDGFVIEFDRPVDPTTFTASDIEIRYHSPFDPNPNGPGTQVPLDPAFVNPIQALNLGGSAPFGAFGATRFLIHVKPQTATGTYSYTIGPRLTGPNAGSGDLGVFDRIRSRVLMTTAGGTQTPPASTDVPKIIRNQQRVTSTVAVSAFAATDVAVQVTVAVNITGTLGDLDVSLIAPDGSRVKLTDNSNAGRPGYAVTFDDTAATAITAAPAPPPAVVTGTFRPVQPLALLNGTKLNGTWTLEVIDDAGTAGAQDGTIDSWSLTLTPGTVVSDPARESDGNASDQNADGVLGTPDEDAFAVPNPVNGTPFQLPYANDTLPLILPGAHVVRTLAQNEVPSATVLDHVVKNKSVSYIDIEFDRLMKSSTFTVNPDVLQVIGPIGPIAGNTSTPISVTPVTNLGGTPKSAADLPNSRYFRVSFPSQTLNGTYRVQLGSDIRDKVDNNGLDTNLNAGLDLLRGTTVGGTASTVIVRDSNPGGIDVLVQAGKSVTYTLPALNDPFLIQRLTATMSLTGDVTKMTAQLVSSDGTSVLLFNAFGRDSGTTGGLDHTVFTDSAFTPNQAAAPPASGLEVTPTQPLSQFIGHGSTSTFSLVLTNGGSFDAHLTQFEVGLKKVAAGPGVGEPISDQAAVGFRIFNLDPTQNQSKNTWAPVGPTEVLTKDNAGNIVDRSTYGRVGAIAVDPSDTSGNTVYVAGATSGIWKTTNFLTTDPAGPTWIPLTDFGPTRAIDIGSLAVSNLTGNPKDTVIIAGTGEKSSGVLSAPFPYQSTGVGFLISTDAGNSWRVLDSTVNSADGSDADTNPGDGAPLPLSDGLRDHKFVGSVVEKVVIDPNRNPATGIAQPIFYAAIAQGTGVPGVTGAQGFWRSTDLGGSWQRVATSGARSLPVADFTDVVLAPASADPASGQIQMVYVASPGNGVYVSVDGGLSFDRMLGGAGKPNVDSLTVNPPASIPTGAAGGRIVLATPALSASDLANGYLKEWLYAAVADAGGNFTGLYMTKDRGRNWTKVRLATTSNIGFGIATNNEIEDGNHINVDVTNGSGDLSLAIAVDPTDPNVVFVGSDTMIRADTTKMADPHTMEVYNHSNPDGGQIRIHTTGPTKIDYREDDARVPNLYVSPGLLGPDVIGRSRRTPSSGIYNLELEGDPAEFPPRRVWNYLNLFRNPDEAFPGASDADLHVINLLDFENNGWDASWNYSQTHRDAADPTTGLRETRGDLVNISRMVSFVDPVTGKARILFGDDEGIHTFVPNADSTLDDGIGFSAPIDGARNGNLQLAQLRSASVQPSLLAADVAKALFYGSAEYPEDPAHSTSNETTTGNEQWATDARGGPVRWTETDATGSGTLYILRSGGGNTFFQIQYPGGGQSIVRTSPGLFQFGDAWGGATKFVVNPIDNRGIAIGNPSGAVYLTTNQGIEGGAGGHDWQRIASSTDLDGTFPEALAFGAPQSRANGAPRNDVLYAGTRGGGVFVTFDHGANWIDLDTGPRAGVLDGSRIQKIVADPGRATRDVFVVTQKGVYYMADTSAAAAGTAAGTWQNLTGSLFNITARGFNNPDWETPLTSQVTQNSSPLAFSTLNLNTMAVDWRFRYFSTPQFPRIYVGGEAGVFRTMDMGKTWTRFPDTSVDGAPVPGGGLPVVNVTDLRLATGKIDPGTGLPVKDASGRDISGSSDLLVAATFGRGLWAIRVPANNSSGPRVVSQSITTPTFGPGGSVSAITVTFDVRIQEGSFDVNDIAAIEVPNQSGIPGGTTRITDRATINAMVTVQDVTTPDANGGNLHNVWKITFNTPLTVDGTYKVFIGPGVVDTAGRSMDQNQNRVNGEATADQYAATFVIANNDLGDLVKDAYGELLTIPGGTTRGPTIGEYLLGTVQNMETARFTSLAKTLQELLATWNGNEARQRLIDRLFMIAGPFANEVGNLLPTYALPPAERAAYVTAMVKGQMSPEDIIIDIMAGNATKAPTNATLKGFGDQYFSVKSLGDVPTFVQNVYQDLFQGTVPFNWLPQSVQDAQLKQAQTPNGRLTLVRNLVTGSVSYLPNGIGTKTVTTSFRQYLVKLAYQKYLGRVPTAAELTDGTSQVGRVKVAATAGNPNVLQGSEWLTWRILSTREFFGAQVQSASDKNPTTGAALPDVGLHTDRAWVDAVINARYFRTADADGDGLISDQAERDTFSKKVLDGFLTQRKAFLNSLVSSAPLATEFRTAEVIKMYRQILGRDPGNPTTKLVELDDALKKLAAGSTFQNLIAGLLGSDEFYNNAQAANPGAPNARLAWALTVYQTMIPSGTWTVADQKVVALANKATVTVNGGAGSTVGSRTSAAQLFLTGTATTNPNGSDYRAQQVTDAFARLLTPAGAPTRVPTAAELAQFQTFLTKYRWEAMLVELMSFSGVDILNAKGQVVTAGDHREYWEVSR